MGGKRKSFDPSRLEGGGLIAHRHIVYDILQNPAAHTEKVDHHYKQLVLRMKLKLRKRVKCLRILRSKLKTFVEVIACDEHGVVHGSGVMPRRGATEFAGITLTSVLSESQGVSYGNNVGWTTI